MKRLLYCMMGVLVAVSLLGCSGVAPYGDYTLSKIEGSAVSGDNSIDLYMPAPLMPNKRLAPTKLAETNDGSSTQIIDGNVVSVFDTTINLSDWLVISINQPEVVTEQYVIQSATIVNPNGSKTKWQSITVDSLGRRMKISLNGLQLYIPVINPSTPGQYEFKVDAIEYLYKQQNYLVSSTENSIDTVRFNVANPEIDQAAIGFENINRLIRIDALTEVIRIPECCDAHDITIEILEVWIADQQITTFVPGTYGRDSTISVPNDIVLVPGITTLKLIYSNGLGGTFEWIQDINIPEN